MDSLSSLDADASKPDGTDLLLMPAQPISPPELLAHAVLSGIAIAADRTGSVKKVQDLGYTFAPDISINDPAGFAVFDDDHAIVAIAPMLDRPEDAAIQSAAKLIEQTKIKSKAVTLTGFGRAASLAHVLAEGIALDAVLFTARPALPQLLFALIATLEAGGDASEEPGVKVVALKAGVELQSGGFRNTLPKRARRPSR